MKIENLNDKTTTRELRKMLFKLESVEADALRHRLFDQIFQDSPANPDDIYAAKVIAFDEAVAKQFA